MLESVRTAVSSVEALVRDFEPWTLDGSTATRLVKLSARLENLGAAGKALAAARVAETGAYRASGAKEASHWLAQTSGVTVGAADKALRTAERLPELSATSDAFRAGRLSGEQAFEISGAALKDPGTEQTLLGVARDRSIKGLREECRRVRAAAEEDDAAWAKRLDQERSLRTWTDVSGAPCGIWSGPPDKGAEILAAIDGETDLIFRQARTEGRREERQAYAFDALHALVTRGPRKRTSATLAVDAGVADQGFAAPGQRCGITGVGPIPVAIAQRMLEDATVRAVARDDSALPDYSAAGRSYPAWLTAWLDARYLVCGAKDCDNGYRLQYDHVVAIKDGGRTEVANLWRLCEHHHDLKTNRGWRVAGATHDWDLVPPDGPDPPDEPDPP